MAVPRGRFSVTRRTSAQGFDADDRDVCAAQLSSALQRRLLVTPVRRPASATRGWDSLLIDQTRYDFRRFQQGIRIQKLRRGLKTERAVLWR